MTLTTPGARVLVIDDPTTRVIIVSGHSDPVLAREALRLGALAYIDEPFDFGYLKQVIAVALRGDM